MNTRISQSFTVVLLCILGFTGQPGPVITTPAKPVAGLFESNEVLPLKLKGKLHNLLSDRSSAVPQRFPITLSLVNEEGLEVLLPVELSTRGHFRRMKENCTYPPLLIRFPETGRHLSTIFRDQHKLKLVMPCAGDQYVIREWLVYRMYNLVTPLSFKTRLVKIQLEDEGKKPAQPFYGLLLEEEKQMATRNGGIPVETNTRPQGTERKSFLTMTVFQYLAGNTDWSTEFLQNIKLVQPATPSLPKAVAYDFDHSGMVSAPYARPAEELQLSSVRERRYRGYCLGDLRLFDPVIADFNRVKNDIYGLYRDCTLLDPKYQATTFRYLDEFYTTINNPKAWQKAFAYPCDKNGTGNIIIKGLKED